MLGRKKKLVLNTSTALANQVVALICGFILPRYMLAYFGSEVNGLVSSITRFLSVISFLEMGVGPVIQSNLYKPLADKDNDAISRIIVAAEKFYRSIAYIFLGYILVLVFVFPNIAADFDVAFTVSLLLIISISTFTQYFFGITYQVFLNADQKIYVHTALQIITVVLNTVLSVILIKLGCGIHIVKLATVGVYLIRPMMQNVYVKRHYHIDKKIRCDKDPIRQKWNGFSQHLAAVVSGEIDVVLLTFVASYQAVSIYSVYHMVVHGIARMILTVVTGLESFWGNMIARNEQQLLRKTFEGVETIVHLIVTIIFTVTAITVTPFIQVYTLGVEDSKAYIMPLFGLVLSLAYACQCMRVPYFRIIKAAGHYKETQNGAYISMMLNIVLSVVLVFRFHLVGVALGTLVAMLFHTMYLAWYLRKHIICRSFSKFVQHFLSDIATFVGGYTCTKWCAMQEVSYIAWFVYAAKVTLTVTATAALFHFVFYHKYFLGVAKKLMLKSKR